MIYFDVSLSNPFSDRFEILFTKHGSVGKHKGWEVNGYQTNTLVTMEFRLNFRCDHAGIKLQFGLLGYELELNCYDSRHWDDENDSWVKYDRSTV